jgi:hypothetical protein
LAGGSIRFTFISDGDIDMLLSTSVMIDVFVESVNEGCKARHVTDAIGKVQKHMTGRCLGDHPCNSGVRVYLSYRIPRLLLQCWFVVYFCDKIRADKCWRSTPS